MNNKQQLLYKALGIIKTLTLELLSSICTSIALNCELYKTYDIAFWICKRNFEDIIKNLI